MDAIEGSDALVKLLVGVGFVALLAHFFWPRGDFVIQVRGGAVTCTGKLPVAQHDAIAAFLRDDLRLQGPVRITGAWNGGRLQLWFAGALTPGQKQRVRNFLLAQI